MKRIVIATVAICAVYTTLALTPSSANSTTTELINGQKWYYSPDKGNFLRIPLNHINQTLSWKHVRSEKLLAGMMFGECRGQGETCMTAVGHVAMNRARLNMDSRYGQGLWGVLKKHKAFSCFLKSDPNKKVIDKAMAEKLTPGSLEAQRWGMAKKIAHQLMHNPGKDPTHNSTHYFATSIRPAWIHDHGMVRVATINGHIFYRREG